MVMAVIAVGSDGGICDGDQTQNTSDGAAMCVITGSGASCGVSATPTPTICMGDTLPMTAPRLMSTVPAAKSDCIRSSL